MVTASKVEGKLPRSTSVMNGITARAIKRSGFRTIYEVLTRVPGFFPSTQATWKLVGTRGLVADGSDHILLLIDGHPQNSIVAHGFQQQDQLPALEKVDRIEIIRGPDPCSGERAPPTPSSTSSPRMRSRAGSRSN